MYDPDKFTARVAQTASALAIGAVLAFTPAPVSAQTFQFSSVAVSGTERVDAATVLAFAEIPRGRAVTAGELNDAFQRLTNSGLFEEVDLIPRGNQLVIEVREWPTVNRINIEGNRRIDDDILLPLLQTQSRRAYDPSVAEADAARIAETYAQRGRLAASVEPRLIRRSDNRVDVVFEVAEGRVVEIQRISFVGNSAFSERRLRNALQTRQVGLLRTFVQADTFIEERIAFDRQALTDFYRSRGYIDFEVLSVSSQLTRQRDGVLLTFTVREGQSFKIGNVTTASEVNGIDATEFQQALRIRPGQTWSPALIDNNIARLERLAIEKQLDFIRVVPRLTRDNANGTVDVAFVLERGPRIFVERIDIEGNVTTLDRVIRRQFNTVEGDPFNPREIRQAAERIRALGFFTTADVSTRQGSSPNDVIVDVDVEEQPTGSLSFGGSYSTQGGIGLSVSLSERNFLGRGQFVSFTYAGGVDNREASFSFAEPAFLDRNLRLTFDGIYATTTSSTVARYDTEVTSVGIGFEFPVSENGRFAIEGSVGQTNLTNVDAGSSQILKNEQGQRSTASLGYTYTFDTRRTGLNPNSGIFARFGQEVTGIGSGNQILRTTALARAETKVLGEEVTLRLDLEGGALTPIAGGTTRITDRFSPGGTNILRGFQANGVGPRDTDATTTNQDGLGGNYFAVARVESEFPLGLPDEYNITGGLFLDVGSVWGLQDTNGGVAGGAPVDDSAKLRATAGFSLFWTTGIGPLRFNFTTPIIREPSDRTAGFDLTLNTSF